MYSYVYNCAASMIAEKPGKPLKQRAYGSIPHLPRSRRGPADKGLSEDQARILTEKARDKHDLITVQEKLDGTCVSVANIDGKIIALIRAGYPASGSNYKQHHYFADWVSKNSVRFEEFLSVGERCVGEWLLQAHGTRYKLHHEPFVIFDIMRDHSRKIAQEAKDRCVKWGFIYPKTIHIGGPVTIESVLSVLEPSGHGAIDSVEGAVWRCERKGEVDFLGKYVRPDKTDGVYLESLTGLGPVWNLDPSLL